MDIREIDDRIGKFFIGYLDNYIFDEFSDNYLKKMGLRDILLGTPIPLKKDELGNMSTLNIALNMAFVMGCDPAFDYTENYIAYIIRTFGKEFSRGLVAEGVEAAQNKDYDYACIRFRSAILIDPENVDALYCYGRACKDIYELGDEEDYIARFKAESIEAFEKVTLKKPDFAEAYYFLGYGYINLGLYIKAKLTWEEFMKLSDDEEKKKEIEERLSTLDDPVKIEEGYNLILSGRYVEGCEILGKYKESRFTNWWPLWYYMGVAHSSMGMKEDAIAEFKKVLTLSPSNIDTMEELIKLYREIGDEENVEKFEKKIAVVRENIEKDRAEVAKKIN